MSYEMKDILKTMIDNNEPHWSADTMKMVKQELMDVYEQASEASELRKQNGILSGQLDTLKINLVYYKKKADEYEAKAKAFDEGLEAVHDRLQHILHNTDTGKLLPGYVDGMYNSLDIINDCYESGERNELQRDK